MAGLFITATDTDIGKTIISGAIAAGLYGRGQQVGVMKPLASGGIADQEGNLQAEDATFLLRAAGLQEEQRQQVNPVCLEPALTPAVAAKVCGVQIDIPALISAYRQLSECYSCMIVEGVGGITAPLWEDYLVADLMQEIALPAIIVARPRLGTINHTVLTADYAKCRGIAVAGIIINGWQEEESGILEESNLAYIERLTKLPVLGKFPYDERIAQGNITQQQLAALAEQHLDMDKITKIIQGGKAGE